MSSGFNCGNSRRSLASLSPAARWLSTSPTVIRVPPTQGFPNRIDGSIQMRSRRLMSVSLSSFSCRPRSRVCPALNSVSLCSPGSRLSLRSTPRGFGLDPRSAQGSISPLRRPGSICRVSSEPFLIDPLHHSWDEPAQAAGCFPKTATESNGERACHRRQPRQSIKRPGTTLLEA